MDAVDGPPEVDLDLFLPLLAGLLQEKAVDGPAYVVDQDVDRSEAVYGLLHHSGDAGRVRNVGGYDHHPAACAHPGDFRRHDLSLAGGELGDHDVGAFDGEGVDNGAANVRTAAGYYDVFPFQSKFHVRSGLF